MNACNFGSQMQTLGVLEKYVQENHYPPTNEELAELRGLTVKQVYTHLRQLQQRGLITRVKGWRNIRLTARVA